MVEMLSLGARGSATGAGDLSNAITLDSPRNTTESQRLQTIRVELSERRRARGGVAHVASCSIVEMESTTAPICKLARELLRLGVDARTPLSIRRGEVECFHDLPISVWADLAVEEGGSETVFRRYKPYSGWAVVSLITPQHDVTLRGPRLC